MHYKQLTDPKNLIVIKTILKNKINMKTIFTTVLVLFFSFSNAQFLEKLAKKAQKSTERAIENKVEQKAAKTTNEGMDAILNNKKTNTNNSSSSS